MCVRGTNHTRFFEPVPRPPPLPNPTPLPSPPPPPFSLVLRVRARRDTFTVAPIFTGSTQGASPVASAPQMRRNKKSPPFPPLPSPVLVLEPSPLFLPKHNNEILPLKRNA